ncbi:thioredoxin [Companilactobacillus versmoldensis DSM 14857 = KCTC 3814]|uniref:Thioredoxin n=1 Tax=Companilactobacillus versmoldensis DSM 14857 = KCTC 3814 TaxID=1423815 RepID=A0A0R1SCG1_9LACO|nr:thioredoxin [Companilactobacillus versmoldensis DSM 14857 = KCTC 3814]
MMNVLKNLTTENFSQKNETGINLLSFSKDWCAQCYTQQPILEQAAEKYRERIHFYQINADDNVDLIKKYNVLSAPSLVVEKDGRAVYDVAGFLDQEQLESIIAYYL